MTDQPTSLRLDPSPSKVFSWLEWSASAPEVRDDRNRLVQPAGPALLVHFRSTGAEWSHWPVSLDEARAVMNPGSLYNFSIGHAYGSVIKAHKSSRMVKPGERQETVRQREQEEKRSGRRWLA
jgi:hypothetical protein